MECDLNEALEKYDSAVNIIEGPLMDAMNYVGELFGEGRLFLPQVVKTARTMQKAVDYLRPHIEAGQSNGRKTGKVLLATVKGDVHDIGKNIVAVVLRCNNYEVIDLGVMCPQSTIVEAALREMPDFIGLSGLITPSLEEMTHTVEALKQAGMNIPVIIGGATTSALHTALKIAPAYNGPVIWAKDASQIAIIAARLTGKSDVRSKYIASIRKEQEILQRNHCDKQEELISFKEAQDRKLNLFNT